MISATIFKDLSLWCLVREYGTSEMTSFYDSAEKAEDYMWERACDATQIGGN